MCFFFPSTCIVRLVLRGRRIVRASVSRKYRFPSGFRDWTPISLAREPIALIYSLQAGATSLARRLLFAARRKEKKQREEYKEKSLVARVCYGNFTPNCVIATPSSPPLPSWHFRARALHFYVCSRRTVSRVTLESINLVQFVGEIRIGNFFPENFSWNTMCREI